MESACSIRYMQIGQKVSGPRDGVRLAGACRMLNQVLANRSLRQHSRSPDHQNGGARAGATRRCARATSHFYGPQRKQSPSPGRGGGLTTAVAGCRSHGFELVRADRSLITGACRRCWMKSDDRSARSVLVVLFRVASGAGPSPSPPSRNLVVTQGSNISPATCSHFSPQDAVRSGTCVIGPPFKALQRFRAMSRSEAFARFT